MIVCLLIAVSAWCGDSPYDVYQDDYIARRYPRSLESVAEEGWALCSEERAQTLKISFPRQDVITLPRVVQNTRDERIAVIPYEVRSDCLPKGLRCLRCETELGRDTVVLYGDGHQELKISLPHEGIRIFQTSGCLLEAVTANSQGNRLSQILWRHKSQGAGDLLLHTPNGGVFTRELSWTFRDIFQDFSEYNFGLESLSITRIVNKYNDGSSVFVRATVAYANLHEVTFSIGVLSGTEVPSESSLLFEVVKL